MCGVYDRYPDQSDPQGYAVLRREMPRVRWGNSPRVIQLCRDKAAAHERLVERIEGVAAQREVRSVGEVEALLEVWGEGVLKPAEGSFARGVSWLRRGDRVALGVGRWVLQSPVRGPALRAPDGLALRAAAIRVLVQRDDGGWFANSPVARCSATSRVVSVKGGAVAWPLRDVLASSGAPPGVLAQTQQRALAVADALDDLGVVLEVGVDIVLDHAWRPWVIEVNGRPRGHLEGLASRDAERWAHLALEARLRPLEALLHAR